LPEDADGRVQGISRVEGADHSPRNALKDLRRSGRVDLRTRQFARPLSRSRHPPNAPDNPRRLSNAKPASGSSGSSTLECHRSRSSRNRRAP
jgi:hypothetical protein